MSDPTADTGAGAGAGAGAAEAGPARPSGSASSNWRDASTWRRNEAPASSPRPSKFTPGRTSGASWRDREERKGAEDGQARGDNTNRRLESSDSFSKSRPYDRARTNKAPQRDDDGAAKAIAEGRRIYIGNLRYQAKPEDIEDLLRANDLGHFTNIHISIDPFTGRNPSYCFVEFPDADSAKTAMEILEGKELLGREVKCRPCQPKGSGSGGKPSEAPGRWGQWSGEKEDDDRSKPKSFERYRQDFTGRRLYVGGLPRMHDQATNFAEMTELFKDFKVEAISKRVSAHESTRDLPGHHDYCFVDFATAEQATEAMESLNGVSFKGDNLKVSVAKGRSNKWRERDELDGKRGSRRQESPVREWGAEE
ncbi:putative RNA recognition motif containing protein [Rosellinia necatrix]|uniref:Putative RNA recognition motif containing protein n=1 Tax=Rosellinia necatrix TaxID=77044 RepID=A0A1S7UKW7_ROSNE|nr:putative RNA recognition motif containing protein [Rosellinia necatrix]